MSLENSGNRFWFHFDDGQRFPTKSDARDWLFSMKTGVSSIKGWFTLVKPGGRQMRHPSLNGPAGDFQVQEGHLGLAHGTQVQYRGEMPDETFPNVWPYR
jgi:hypothetical protein